jgi:hypothetical protein
MLRIIGRSRLALAFLHEARLCGANERLSVFVHSLWLTRVLRTLRQEAVPKPTQNWSALCATCAAPV